VLQTHDAWLAHACSRLIADCWSLDILATGSEARKASGRGGGASASNAATWAVSEVVTAVQHRGTPVPYRLSRLTRYLQDTLQPAGSPIACLMHVQQLPGTVVQVFA
jgi:hypothetical protein